MDRYTDNFHMNMCYTIVASILKNKKNEIKK